MNLLGVDRESARVARDSVIEAHAQRYQQVGLFERHACVRHPVHPGPARGQNMPRREAAHAQKCRNNGYLRLLGKFQQFVIRP